MKRLLIPVVLVFACGRLSALPAVRAGDIIFHTSRSSQSRAIQRATASPYSHMGIILLRGGKPYVFEAISTAQFTPLDRWIARGNGHHYVVKRLKNASVLLTGAAVHNLEATAKRFQGRPYDLTFEWSDTKVYCSELVWKLYERTLGLRIGELQRIKDLNLTDPAVRSKMRERYGDSVPSEEPVITPVAMFNSSLLETVAER